MSDFVTEDGVPMVPGMEVWVSMRYYHPGHTETSIEKRYIGLQLLDSKPSPIRGCYSTPEEAKNAAEIA